MMFARVFGFLIMCVAVVSSIAGAAICRNDNLIFSTSSANTNIYSFDPTNALAPLLRGASSFISAAAARSPIDGKIYYISEEAAPRLSSFDPATNTAGTPVTLSGLNAGFGTFVRAGFNSAGALYAGDNSLANVYTIDVVSGVATPVAVANMPVGPGDLAFDPVNPNQYYSVVLNGTSFDLYKVTILSATTAAATLVGSTGVASTVRLFGIAYGNDGLLYAGDQATNPTVLYRLNTATGAATATGITKNIVGGINDFASLPTLQNVDLGIVKTHTNANPIYPNTTLTYQLKVTNNSLAATGCTLASLSVTDPLPATLNAASATYTPSTGTYASGTGVWTGLALAPGNSITLTIAATINAGTTGAVNNTATVAPPAGGTPGIPDPVPGNNTSTDTATVIPLAHLTVTKTAPATAALNGLIAYSVLVSNPGPSAANGTTFGDTLPAGTTIVGAPTCAVTSGAAACGSVAVVNSTVSSTIATLPSGSSVTFSINARATAIGSPVNTATIAPPNGTADQKPNSSSVTTAVTANAGFTKTVRNVTSGETTGVSADTGKPGDTLEYGISFNNRTGSPISSFSISDVIPTNTTYVSASCGVLPTGVTACTVTPPSTSPLTVRYTYTGALASGSTGTFLLRTKIN